MRTREFDKNEVLMSSMRLFWKKGYFDTSIEDLTQATGVSRSGIYGEFKNKRELFLAAIGNYEKAITNHFIYPLETPQAGLSEIRQLFAGFLSAMEAPQGKLGCLICNTSSEVALFDKRIAARVTGYHDRVRSAFANALSNSKLSGDLDSSFDVDQGANYFLCVLQGLAHAMRSPMKRESIRDYVKLSLSVLNQN